LLGLIAVLCQEHRQLQVGHTNENRSATRVSLYRSM
jgi:hypothetical protein